MNVSCSKCSSTEVLTEIPVVTSKGFAVSAMDDRHRFLARVCGSCGFAEFDVEDPKGLVAVARQVEDPKGLVAVARQAAADA